MPVQIGANLHSFSNPTGMLSDCHRRIEMFLGSLQAVAKVVDRPLDREAREALDIALRYFREAAPKHTADEEESLFPRMRRIRHPDIQSALTKLEELEKDHRWAAPLHAEVERLGRICLSNGNLSQSEAESFHNAVSNLVVMYQQHIRVEDGLIFPAAARLLPATDQAGIAEEMAARRRVRWLAEIAPVREQG
jgi:hemerythrin-like domain-containing protein